MATTATFSRNSKLLSVFGDALDNTIVTSRDAAGNILVNGGAVNIIGGRPTVANTAEIDIFGLGGNDTITVNEANGAMPAAHLFGGDGNDVLTGGSGGDLLFGQSGNDTLLGKGGNDQLFGGDGNDTLTGGDGNDQMFGQAGDDRMIWNPGDDTDLFEGGTGNDTAEVNGGNGAENFTITPNGARVRFDRVDPAPFSIDIGTTENLVINANGGDDIITASNGLSTLIKLTIDGGTGNDRITGGDGNDTLRGGDGKDVINGGRGNDTALLGTGDDTFVWNPGDGSDTVEGQDGFDTMQFNGANIAEKIDISANGSRVRFTRDVASVTMDTNGVERIAFNSLGGADTITVNDLTGTGVTQVALDLGGNDNAADTVVLNATSGNDVITVTEDNGVVTVSGLGEDVTITNFGAGDRLVINGLGGDDVITASGVSSTLLITENGGEGNDVLIGSLGNDSLHGENGDDILLGGGGQDVLDGGPGDNVVLQSAMVTFPDGGGVPLGGALLRQAMAANLVATGSASAATPTPDQQTIQGLALATPHA